MTERESLLILNSVIVHRYDEERTLVKKTDEDYATIKRKLTAFQVDNLYKT